MSNPNTNAKSAAMDSAGKIGLDIADTCLINNGIGYRKIVGKGKGSTKAVNVDTVVGLKVLGAGAGATTDNAFRGVSVSPIKQSAFAGASVAQTSANAYLVEGLEVNAKATLLDANASAGFGVTGVHAGAGARYARAEAGMKNTPLQAHVELAGANAETGVSLAYTGASAGAHLGEAKAGPFAVRAGLKVGACIRNGVPEVDLGPVTAPCSVM